MWPTFRALMSTLKKRWLRWIGDPDIVGVTLGIVCLSSIVFEIFIIFAWKSYSDSRFVGFKGKREMSKSLNGKEFWHTKDRTYEYEYSRWIFSDTSFQRADIYIYFRLYRATISTSGIGWRRTMLTIAPVGQASSKTWVEPLEFLKYLN